MTSRARRRAAGGGGGNDAFTKLLLHFDGVDGATTTTDSSASANTLTSSNSAQIDTAQFVFGVSSGLFLGNSTFFAAASADWNFGTGDFTIDTWVRFNTSARQYLLDIGSNGAALIITPSSGRVEVYGPSSAVIDTGSTPFSTGVWYHIAIVRSGNSWTFYRDGVAYASVTDSRSWGGSGSNFFVGRFGGSATGLNGWFDEFRVSKGIARWTSGFTPPTAAYS